mgnify:CR=1 FL=1
MEREREREREELVILRWLGSHSLYLYADGGDGQFYKILIALFPCKYYYLNWKYGKKILLCWLWRGLVYVHSLFSFSFFLSFSIILLCAGIIPLAISVQDTLDYSANYSDVNLGIFLGISCGRVLIAFWYIYLFVIIHSCFCFLCEVSRVIYCKDNLLKHTSWWSFILNSVLRITPLEEG